MNISPNSARVNLSPSSASVNKTEIQTSLRSAKKLLGTKALTDNKVQKTMNQLATKLAQDSNRPCDLARAGSLLKAGVQVKGQGTVHGSWLGQIRDKYQSQKTEKILKKIDNILAKNGFNSTVDSEEDIEALYAKPTRTGDKKPDLRLSLTPPPLPPKLLTSPSSPPPKPPRAINSAPTPSRPAPSPPSTANVSRSSPPPQAAPRSPRSASSPQNPPPVPRPRPKVSESPSAKSTVKAPIYAELVRPGEEPVTTDNPRPSQHPPGESLYAQVKSA